MQLSDPTPEQIADIAAQFHMTVDQCLHARALLQDVAQRIRDTVEEFRAAHRDELRALAPLMYDQFVYDDGVNPSYANPEDTWDIYSQLYFTTGIPSLFTDEHGHRY